MGDRVRRPDPSLPVPERVGEEGGTLPGLAGAGVLELLSGVLAHLPVILWRVDGGGVFLLSRGAGLARLGLEDDEVRGVDVLESFPESADWIRRALAGETVTYEAQGETGNGPWSFLSYVFPVPGAEGGAVGFSIDITDRTEAEEQVRHAQRMEALGRLAAGVAHDFNNLMTVILASSSLLLQAPANAPESRPDLERIRDAARRAKDLTERLLVLGRRKVLRPRVLDLNRTAREMEPVLEPLVGEGIELRIVERPGLWLVEADPGQIQQVILNLVINARDAVGEGGTISVELENMEREGEERVRLLVKDDGSGIPREVLGRIFDPYFTTKEDSRGTGLGLSTVLGIVEQSGGEVVVDTAEGLGTAFQVFLPRTRARPEGQTDRVRPSAPPASPVGGRVLVVEDDPGVRLLTVRILEGRGYRVESAACGADAVALVEGADEAFDLVLTDVVMPGMSGRDVAARLRTLQPDLAVLFMTGGGTEGLEESLQAAGERRDCLSKPFEPADLVSAVERVLGSGPGRDAGGS